MSARASGALVTGADNPHGIGRAVCRELAARGHAVAFTAAASEHPALRGELRALGAPAAAGLQADLADATAPAALLQAAARALGDDVRILVNNAAHSTRDGFEALDAATIDEHLAVNARAPMLLSVLLARRLRDGDGGRIVNLVSGQFLGPMPGELAYTASKGALEAFTRQLSAEVAHLAITVNAVGPGPNDTGWIDDDLRELLMAKFPMGRIGQPQDAARVVAWLCSPDAAWVTGQVVHAEGGFLRT